MFDDTAQAQASTASGADATKAPSTPPAPLAPPAPPAIPQILVVAALLLCAKDNSDYLIEAIKAVGLTKLSLNPELKLAYLVPRKGKIYFSSSYMGKREILMRAGIVQWVEANLVYEGDVFEVSKGTSSGIVHKPDYFGDNHTKEKIKGGYWVACLPNGNVVFDVMPLSRIHEIMSRSESVKSGKGSPWDTDFEMMARKTILNWGFGSLPKTGISEHILKVIETETKMDNDDFEEWKKQQEQEAESRMRQKAIEAFDDMWFSDFEPDYEYHRENFIKKLKEE